MKRRLFFALLLGALSGLAARALVAPPSRTIRIVLPACDPASASPQAMARD